MPVSITRFIWGSGNKPRYNVEIYKFNWSRISDFMIHSLSFQLSFGLHQLLREITPRFPVLSIMDATENDDFELLNLWQERRNHSHQTFYKKILSSTLNTKLTAKRFFAFRFHTKSSTSFHLSQDKWKRIPAPLCCDFTFIYLIRSSKTKVGVVCKECSWCIICLYVNTV